MAHTTSAEFRRACSRFATGVTVVTVGRADGEPKGMTANSFTSVSLAPPLVLVCVDLRARTHALLKRARHFGVSVLDEHQQAAAQYFAATEQDATHMAALGIRFRREANGVPYIESCLAHMICRRVGARRAGDHTIFIGEVEHLACREGRPLLFYGGKYRAMSGGPG